jgi:hypothetical protein
MDVPLPSKACKLCLHQARQQIEDKLYSQVPYRVIGKEYGCSEATVARHKAHMTAQAAIRMMADPKGSATEVRKRQADEAALKARKGGDIRAEMVALREWRALDEHSKRLEQEERNQERLVTQPAFQRLVGMLGGVLCESCRKGLDKAHRKADIDESNS